MFAFPHRSHDREGSANCRFEGGGAFEREDAGLCRLSDLLEATGSEGWDELNGAAETGEAVEDWLLVCRVEALSLPAPVHKSWMDCSVSIPRRGRWEDDSALGLPL